MMIALAQGRRGRGIGERDIRTVVQCVSVVSKERGRKQQNNTAMESRRSNDSNSTRLQRKTLEIDRRERKYAVR